MNGNSATAVQQIGPPGLDLLLVIGMTVLLIWLAFKIGLKKLKKWKLRGVVTTVRAAIPPVPRPVTPPPMEERVLPTFRVNSKTVTQQNSNTVIQQNGNTVKQLNSFQSAPPEKGQGLSYLPGQRSPWWSVAEGRGALIPDWYTALIYDLTRNKLPHLMVVGKTGSGKTFLTRTLVMELSYRGKIVILDPHASPHWGMEAIGLGLNYDAIKVGMKAIRKEMLSRFQEYAAGKKDTEQFVPMFVFIDEWPAIKGHLENAATDFMKEMARESRKVGIHLVILTQSERVESLGISGEGDVREAFVKLLLGPKAKEALPNFDKFFNTKFPSAMEYDGKVFQVEREFMSELSGLPVNQGARFVVDNLPPPPSLDDEAENEDLGYNDEEGWTYPNDATRLVERLNRKSAPPVNNITPIKAKSTVDEIPVDDYLKVFVWLTEESPVPSQREMARRLGYSPDGGGRAAHEKVKSILDKIAKVEGCSTVPVFQDEKEKSTV